MSVSYLDLEDPVVGGYAPHQLALRRTISLAVEPGDRVHIVRRVQAMPAGPIAPCAWGCQLDFKSEMSAFSRARPMALLDMHGYANKNGDGYREQSDGSPLVLQYSTQPDQLSPQPSQLWRKIMDAVGIRIEFRTASWPQNLKSSRAGQLMMWGAGARCCLKRCWTLCS